MSNTFLLVDSGMRFIVTRTHYLNTIGILKEGRHESNREKREMGNRGPEKETVRSILGLN